MMSRLICLALLLHLIRFNANAQYENVWAFGHHDGIDFNSGSPVPIATSINADEGCASICDSRGQLLFYTEGYNVWDKNGNLMPNGVKILGDIANGHPTASTTQAAVILPMPGSTHKYYIFSLTSMDVFPTTAANRLYYSVLDINLNGGLGDIVPAQKGVFMEGFLSEMMTAVTGDRCNAWLLVIDHGNNKFKAYSINEDGIAATPVISDLLPVNFGANQGNITVAASRKKIAINRMGLGLYDFDISTGKLYGQVALLRLKTPQLGRGDVAFSPDDSKLYASIREEEPHLYQFDLGLKDSASIVNSKFSIGNYFMHALKTGPDGKVYTSNLDVGIGVVAQPNLSGAACQFLPQLRLGNSGMVTAFPNTIAALNAQTIITHQAAHAPCFANVHPMTLSAQDSEGWDYLWSDGTTGFSRTVTAPGTYSISYYTPPCNLHIDSFEVSFPNGVLPAISIRNACKAYPDGRAWAHTYPGDTVTYHYTWINGNSDTLSREDTLRNVPSGTYRLRVTTAQCDTLISFFIPAEDFSISFKVDTLVCSGNPLSIKNTSDPHFTRFLWDFGNGDTTTALPEPSYTYRHPGQFELRLTGQGAVCTDTAYQMITVDAIVKDLGLQKDRAAVCIGETIRFHPQTDSTTQSLVWDFGDGSRTRTGVEGINHAYDQSGHLRVQLTAGFRVCPELQVGDSIFVAPPPRVMLNRDSSICYKGQPILLYNHAPASPSDQYLWQNGSRDTFFEVRQPGRYSLTLINNNGCSTTEYVDVLKDCYTDMPNAFSPNGDHVNDYFYPRQLLRSDVASMRLRIFNRWGQLVFQTTNKEGHGWDGRFNEQDQPQGVYIYTIHIVMNNGSEESYEGNITLIR